MKAIKFPEFCLFLGLVGFLPLCHAGSMLDPTKSSVARCNLTDMDEFKEIFGPPIEEMAKTEGDMSLVGYRYENGQAIFGKPKREEKTSFVLLRLGIDGKFVDIGCDSKKVLRGEKDLNKLNKFTGFSGVSLKHVDLRGQSELVRQTTFDNETEWPDKLPEGFKPDRILELGKNPGLGVRELHKAGIKGNGIGIAIIDQPLLLGHTEYRDGIVYYDAVEVPDTPPQMHGSPVASIAVGKSLGVAPEAKLYYFATPTWKSDNRYYAEALNRVLELNRRLPKNQQIRVVSISFGGFRETQNYPLWEEALRKATAQGIYVSTCSPDPLFYLNLALDFSEDPDDPASYAPTGWAAKVRRYPETIFIPGGNRTAASYRGIETYQSFREAGLSWSAPYLAGIAALVFQVNPEISPDEIVKLIRDTATPVPFGKIVNPGKIISEAKALKK